jgi:hypothetical protein
MVCREYEDPHPPMKPLIVAEALRQWENKLMRGKGHVLCSVRDFMTICGSKLLTHRHPNMDAGIFLE